MYGLSSSNHDLAPANVQSVLTAMRIAVFRYNRLLIHQLSRPDVLQSNKNLAILEMIYEELMIINSSASLISSFPSFFLRTLLSSCLSLQFVLQCDWLPFVFCPPEQFCSFLSSTFSIYFLINLPRVLPSPLSLFIWLLCMFISFSITSSFLPFHPSYALLHPSFPSISKLFCYHSPSYLLSCFYRFFSHLFSLQSTWRSDHCHHWGGGQEWKQGIWADGYWW